MTRFYIKAPGQNLRITTTEIHYPDLETGKWVSRWRAKEKLSGIDTGGKTEKEAYYNLVQHYSKLHVLRT